MTEDHVKVLERFVSDHKYGFIIAAIRTMLEENERLRAIEGVYDGTRQDLVNRCYGVEDCIDAALVLLATRHTSNPQCYYCRELIAERAKMVKILLGSGQAILNAMLLKGKEEANGS